MANLTKKLFDIQGELLEAPLVKNATNPHFGNKYISLDSLLDTALPIFRTHEVLMIQAPSVVDGRSVLMTSFIDIETPDGESVGWPMPLVLSKDDPQAMGSAITYARRHSLMAILGLSADEDDDAEAASHGDIGDTDYAAQTGPVKF